jgi:hypothetical protein
VTIGFMETYITIEHRPHDIFTRTPQEIIIIKNPGARASTYPTARGHNWNVSSSDVKLSSLTFPPPQKALHE